MKKLFWIAVLLLSLFSSCFTAKLNFQDNYSQWNFVGDSDIVYNGQEKLMLDFFVETGLQPLTNRDGDADEDLHFVTKRNYSKKILRNKYFCNVFRQIPVCDSICYLIADEISLFRVKNNNNWKPDYMSSSFEDNNWVLADDSNFSFADFNDSIVLRNLVFDNKNMVFVVVDRLKLKGKIYGLAYTISTKSRKYNFNSYCLNVTKPENIDKNAWEAEFCDQFSKRFVRWNNFGIPIDYQAVNRRLNVSPEIKIKDKILLNSFEEHQDVYYDKSLKAGYESARQLIFDFGKDTVCGFEDFLGGNVQIIAPQSDTEKKIAKQVPLFKETIANFNDKIIVFDCDDNKRWRPNYEIKADERIIINIDDEYYPGGKEDIWTPNHKSQPYNFIWRNLIFDRQQKQIFVIDRMNLKDHNIAVAYVVKSSAFDVTSQKNCIVTSKYLNALTSYSRRIAQNNNYWTVIN